MVEVSWPPDPIATVDCLDVKGFLASVDCLDVKSPIAEVTLPVFEVIAHDEPYVNETGDTYVDQDGNVYYF